MHVSHLLAVLAISVSGLAVASPASSGGAPPPLVWSAPVTLDETSRGARDVAVNADGDAVVVWSRRPFDPSSIFAVYRPAGGSWGPRTQIGYGTEPQVALDARGNATAIWSVHPQDWGDAVHAARRPHRAGTWTNPVVLSRPAREPGDAHRHDGTYPLWQQVGAGRPMLEVNADGDTVVVWHWRADGDGPRDGPHDDFVVQAVRRPSGGRWSDVMAVSNPRPPRAVKSAVHAVGMDRRGAVTVMWVRYDNRESPTDGRIMARSMRPRGEWTPTTTLSRDAWDGNDWFEDRDWTIDLAVSARDHAIAVFGRYAIRPAGGTWSRHRALRLGANVDVAFPPFLVMDRAGTAYAATNPAGIARKPLGRRWRWQGLPSMDNASLLSIEGNNSGDVLLYGEGEDDERLAAYRSRSGAVVEAVVLTEETYGGALATAVYPRGGAIAVWATRGHQIQLRELLPAAPEDPQS